MRKDPLTREERRAERRKSDQARMVLHTIYPSAFAGKGEPKRPLMLGVFHELMRRRAEHHLSRPAIEGALQSYTRGPTYLRACAPGTPRIGLDGQPQGEVNEGQAQWAVHRLANMERKWERERIKAAGRKAERAQMLAAAE